MNTSLTVGLLTLLAITAAIAGVCVAIYRYVEPKENWQFAPLKERIQQQVKLQWRWAAVYSFLDITLTVLSWGSAAALLGFSTYHARVDGDAGEIAGFVISALTTLAVSIPLLMSTLDVSAKQKAHAKAALAFDSMWCRLHYSNSQGHDLRSLEEQILAEYMRTRGGVPEHVTLDKNMANKAPEPTPTAVTPPAAQESRQP